MKESFASRANKILKSYERRLGKDFTKDDPLAQRGLELQLSQLRDEQEEFKLDSQADEFATNYINQLEEGGWIQEAVNRMEQKGTKGALTRQAKKAGYESAKAFAKHVLANKEDYSGKTVKRANFAVNVGKKLGGTLPKFQGKNNSWLPGNTWQNAGITMMEDPYELPVEVQDIAHKNALQGEQGKLLDLYTDVDNNTFYGGPKIPEVSNVTTSTTNNNTRELYTYQQNLTDAVPLIASLAGNALMYAQGSKEPRKLKLKRVNADYEKVDLSREREAANREANLARNITIRNARNLGLSGGAAATVASASNVDISRGLGETVGRSYMNEELANTQAANQAKGRADAINSNLEYQEKVHNIRQSDMSDAMKQQAIQNIIGSVGKYFGDVSNKEFYTNYLQMSNPNYKLYQDPNQSRTDRIVFGGKYGIYTTPNQYSK